MQGRSAVEQNESQQTEETQRTEDRKMTEMTEMKNRKRISAEQVQELYKEFNTPVNVIAHCKAVTDCGLRIAKALNAKGYKLDLDLIRGAGLSHDAARVMDRHWDVMADKLKELGYDDEAAIVKVHMDPREYSPIDELNESDIICLGDRLVKEDKYVGIDERFDYIIDKAKRYGVRNFDEILANKAKMQTLLDDIEKVIGRSIDSLFDEESKSKV